MPGAVDGTALVRHIRAEWPFLKVAMMSGRQPEATIMRMLDAHMSKPVLDIVSVVRTLEAQIRQAPR